MSAAATEQQLREKLRKISALFEGATTAGEKAAAAAALERIRKALAETQTTERPEEFRFSLQDQWERRLFSALCRRYGLKPYRYKRQRSTTVMVMAPASFVYRTLWPEFQALKQELFAYLNAATERIIRDEVYGDASDAAMR